MLLTNTHRDYRLPLGLDEAQTLGTAAAIEVERQLSFRERHEVTPLRALPGLARRLGIGAVHVKDEDADSVWEASRALGGAYAVIHLVLEQASRQLGRAVDIAELPSPEVRALAGTMTFTCATDGNHGRSVAQGAQLAGAAVTIFVHPGVSESRRRAIEQLGATLICVDGTYDDSVREAARLAAERRWIVVSDTSWPGYERIPGLVMQGYTLLVHEALRQLPQPPTHVFVQAGVGGIAAAVAAHLALVLGDRRPFFTVVEPARAACIFESARAGKPVAVAPQAATIMAMLECYEPSLIAWRILSRLADAFMTVDEDDAVAAMRRLAAPHEGDPAIVAGESGGVGLAGLTEALSDPVMQATLGLDGRSRVFLINTEGATDPVRYEQLVGRLAIA